MGASSGTICSKITAILIDIIGHLKLWTILSIWDVEEVVAAVSECTCECYK
jgi:hypothetical protein